MSKSDNVPMMYEVFPAVAALNRVDGFNPLKMLRRIISPKTGEEVLRLDLQYKKLWFRLRHPNGRIRVNPLRITEQIAIYEAQVFLNREDTAPVCSFTSSIRKEEAPEGKYIQAAQEDAVDNALTDAGFGIQLSDVSTPESMRHYGSEIPVSQLTGKKSVPAEKTNTAGSFDKPVVQVPSAPEQSAAAFQQPQVSKEPERPMKAVTSGSQMTPKVTQPFESAKNVAVKNEARPATLPKETVQQKQNNSMSTNVTTMTQPVAASQPKPAEQTQSASAALEVLRGAKVAVEKSQLAPAQAEGNDNDLPYTIGPAYNNSMTPDEIAAVMTMDQARAVVVDTGVCKGMTMGEVAEKRPVSLKFYLFGGYRGDNNILKAAAKVLYDQLQKAA